MDAGDFLDALWSRDLWLVPSPDGNSLEVFGTGELTPRDADMIRVTKTLILEFLAPKPDSTPKTSVGTSVYVGSNPTDVQPTFSQPVTPQDVVEPNVGYVGYVGCFPTHTTGEHGAQTPAERISTRPVVWRPDDLDAKTNRDLDLLNAGALFIPDALALEAARRHNVDVLHGTPRRPKRTTRRRPAKGR